MPTPESLRMCSRDVHSTYIDNALQVQQMMKVKAEREDVRQENTKLQSDLRKLQRTLDAKLAEPAVNTEADKKLQEQLQVVSQEKAGLQEQVQQLQQQQASLAPVPQQPTAEKEGGAQGYPQTWKLVDQLRNQNRSAAFTYIDSALQCCSMQKAGSQSFDSLKPLLVYFCTDVACCVPSIAVRFFCRILLLQSCVAVSRSNRLTSCAD